MKLVPYKRRNEWGTLVNFQNEMNRFFDDWFGKFPSLREHTLITTDFSPSADVWEDKDNIYAEVDLPGVDQKDVNVNLRGNTLEISAKKEHEKEEKKRSYSCIERFRGSFYRALDLSTTVDEARIKASYKSGVLKITLPKKEKEKTKEIKVNIE